MSPQSRLSPLIVTGVAALLYLATLSRHFTGDSIEYALAIELGDPAWLLDPYHPLLHPLGLLVFRLWQALGWTGRALLPLQVLNALAGALCAGLLADSARRLTRSGWLALLAGLGFAFSGGLWMLSVEAEFVTPALAAALLVLWALSAASPRRAATASTAVLLALLTAVAFWSYASAAVLVPVVAVGILADGRLSKPTRRRQLLLYAAALLAIVVPATLLFLTRWSEGDWSRVATYFLARGGYSGVAWFDFAHGGYGFLRSLALYPGLSLTGTTRQFLAQASSGGTARFVLYYGLIALIALAPVVAALRLRARWLPDQRRLLIMLIVWSAGYALFAVLWVPGDVSFWLPVLAAWWLATALTVGACRSASQPLHRRRWLVGLAVAVVGLGVANAAFEVLPRAELSTNHPYQVAAEVAAGAGEDAIFLARADDISGLYLAYFHRRQVTYISDDTLARLADYLDGLPKAGAPRVYALDADDGRAAWWRERLAGRGWLSRLPPAQPQAGLLLELTQD